MPISLIRGFLLVIGVLAVGSATALDGIMMRQVVQPMFRLLERQAGGAPVRYPAPLQFMLEHAWARRTYHLLFAAITLALWWYLGTPAGVESFARLQQPH
jgi:hypothetical protein